MSHILEDKTEERSIEELMEELIKQIKIMNLHLKIITDVNITKQEIE